MLGALLSPVAGCAEHLPATELLVVVHAEPGLSGEIEALELAVEKPGEAAREPRTVELRVSKDEMDGGAYSLPLAFSVTPGPKGPSARVTIDVAALARGGSPLATVRIESDFVRHSARRIDLFLARECTPGVASCKLEGCLACSCITGTLELTAANLPIHAGSSSIEELLRCDAEGGMPNAGDAGDAGETEGGSDAGADARVVDADVDAGTGAKEAGTDEDGGKDAGFQPVLTLELAAVVAQAQCTKLHLAVDEAHAEPRTIELALEGDGAFYADADCTQESSTSTLAASETLTTHYFAPAPNEQKLVHTLSITASLGLSTAKAEIEVRAHASAVASGKDFTCAIVAGRAVRCFGRNGVSQLGSPRANDGDMYSRPRAVTIASSSELASIHAGHYFACARTTGGVVFCWGDSSYGQLGNWGVVSSPTALPGGLVFDHFATGAAHVCGLASDGKLYCMGNRPGVSNGAFLSGTSFREVPNVSGVTRVAAGYDHSCAITGGGTAVHCFGKNEHCQLGHDGESSETPVQVAGLPTSGITEIGAGKHYGCAIAAGQLYCWGNAPSGFSATASAVGGLPSAVQSLSAGEHHLCVRKDELAYCLGLNRRGQLGVPAATSLPATRVLPPGLPDAKASAVAAGNADVSCAIFDGLLYCFGDNTQGALGVADINARPTPARHPHDPGGVSAIAMPGDQWTLEHAYCLVAGNDLRCYGNNAERLLGPDPFALPGSSAGVSIALPEPRTNLQAAVGGRFACALVSGDVYCWGGMYSGTPTLFLSGASTIAVGGAQACAVVGTGLSCWGAFNDAGQLGREPSFGYPNPPGAVALDPQRTATAVSVGRSFGCAIVDGGVQCWGMNENFEIGYSDTSGRWFPDFVPGVGEGAGVTAIASGWAGTCFIQNGGVKCFGIGRLRPDGGTANTAVPVSAVGLASGVTAIAVGGDRACAIKNGDLYCWGDNQDGALGSGNFVTNNIPQKVLGPGVSAVGTGFNVGSGATCAVKDSELYCFGANTYASSGRACRSSKPRRGSFCPGITDVPSEE